MKVNPIKTFVTSCPFPVLEYKANVSYYEVKKPSGISYILLELIQKSAMGEEYIKDVLKRFGIPSELHYIFAEDIEALVETGILSTRINPRYISNMNYFDQMTLEMFELTPMGVKMFSEGAIPKKDKTVKRVTVFYHPVTRTFALSSTGRIAPIETSFLGADFLERVEYDVSGMEDELQRSKKRIGLKAEEMIVDVEYDEPKKLVARADGNLTVTIDADGVEFSFATTDENAFFGRYYTSALMSAGMRAKDNYKFNFDVPTANWQDLRPDNLHLPSELNKQLQRRCEFFIAPPDSKYVGTNKAPVLKNSEKYLELLDGNAAFAQLDNSGCRYYMPLNIRIPCKSFGDVFEIQMLVETVATEEQYMSILREIYRDCYESPYSGECAGALIYICTVLKRTDLLEKYTRQKMSELDSDEDRIHLLLSLNSAFSRCDGWAEYFARISGEYFDAYAKRVKLENIILVNDVLSPLRKAMKMPNRTYIAALANPLKEKESPELVYQALETVSFSESEILTVVNVVELYANRVIERVPIDGVSGIASAFALFGSNLWKLCDMLGVESPSKYTLRDDYNVDEFFDTYTTYSEAKKNVARYSAYAKDAFRRLGMFDPIFDNVQEILSIERTAAEHPDSITESFIDEQIRRGRYSVAISNLLIKAQYDLRILLSADRGRQAKELIGEAEKKGVISSDVAGHLHRLNRCRNSLQHPESTGFTFNSSMIEEWKKIVFSLKGES